MIELKKISQLNVSDKMKVKLINKEIWKYRKICIENLKIEDPKAYEKMKKARRKWYKKWRLKNPDYNKLWLRKWYKKHPEKQKEYQIRYWLKRAMSRNQD
ncbi:hypothetical protein ES708_02404 [subsurface metagenome]